MGSKGKTHTNKPPNPRPQRIIRQLPPPPLVHHRPLIRHPPRQIHGHGNQCDDAEDAPRGQALRGGDDAPAGGHGARFEEVGT